MQGLVYDKNLVNATKRSAAHSGVSHKQKQEHCNSLPQLFCFLQLIQKCQRIICSHFVLSIISLTMPFAHPQHCCHLPAFLPDWPKDFTATSRAYLKVFAQESFSPKNVLLIALLFNLSSIKIENLSRVVNQREAIQSTVSSAKTTNLTQGPTSAIRIEFWSICIHICTYWFASVVIPCCKLYVHRNFPQNIRWFDGINYYSMKKLLK